MKIFILLYFVCDMAKQMWSETCMIDSQVALHDRSYCCT